MALSGIITQKQKASDKNAVESNRSDSENEADTHTGGNAGWADSIAKVLGTTKPKAKKTLVLSRAKKTTTQPSDSRSKGGGAAAAGYGGFEVEGEEILDDKPDPEKLQAITLKHRKNMQLAVRVKPSWKDMERERTLRKVATRGVVQLFNAVRIQQKDLQHQLDEAGPLDSRKEAVLNNINKRKFLDVLMSGKRAKSEAVDNSIKNETKTEESSDDDEDDETNRGGGKKQSEWDVLRLDFMTNKKIKHWDEEDDVEGDDQKDDDSYKSTDEAESD